jgi:DNA-binding Xre family transcriptional regulator
MVSTTIQPRGVYSNYEAINTPTIDVNPKKKFVEAQSDTTQSRENNAYLRIEVIQKMISRFLIEKKMPKQNLAEALGITIRSLNQLCSRKAPQALILKVNLSLIKLYCEAKFW